MRKWLALLVFILEPLFAIFVPVGAVYTILLDLSLAPYVIFGGAMFVILVIILRPVALEAHTV